MELELKKLEAKERRMAAETAAEERRLAAAAEERRMAVEAVER